ncbi:MAG TPA: amidohydrolase family protein [Candidatus Angelobacter sp.]|jgi:imidazolonepropionase-like amidohydrolase|nr:amidohydrolase family protein [Candidatus Angelobacter sp.]
MDDKKIDTLAKRVAASKVWITPTILVMDYQTISSSEAAAVVKSEGTSSVPTFERKMWPDPRQIVDVGQQKRDAARSNFRKMLVALRKHHARFLIGTDCGNPFVVAGYSFPEEAEELVSAGFSRSEVLRAATVNAAESLGRNDLGAVAVGKTADFVLLNASPLEYIHAMKSVEGVVVKGRWYSKEQIQRLIDTSTKAPSKPN